LFDLIDRCRIISGRDIDDIYVYKEGVGLYWVFGPSCLYLQPLPFKYRVMVIAYILDRKGISTGTFMAQESNNAQRSLVAKKYKSSCNFVLDDFNLLFRHNSSPG
jgi:hypothetical protein